MRDTASLGESLQSERRAQGQRERRRRELSGMSAYGGVLPRPLSIALTRVVQLIALSTTASTDSMVFILSTSLTLLLRLLSGVSATAPRGGSSSCMQACIEPCRLRVWICWIARAGSERTAADAWLIPIPDIFI